MSAWWEITAGCCTEVTHKLHTKEKVPNEALKEKALQGLWYKVNVSNIT
jgi:hypothetical protein